MNSLSKSPLSPRVSILVTNYNHARYLPDRWASIFVQNFKDIELIFLDDGSTDGSVDLVRGYASSRPIRVETEVSNKGVFAQWRKGIELARGEYIWIAEADDVCSADFLQRLVHTISACSDIGIAYAQSSIIDGSGRVLERTPSYLKVLDSERWTHDYINRGADEVRDWLILRNTIPNVSGCLFRHAALKAIDVEKLGMKLCGDWMTYVQLLSSWKIAFVKEPLNQFRRHARTARAASDRTGDRIRESYWVQNYIARNHAPSVERLEWAARISFSEWEHLMRSSPDFKQRIDQAPLLAAAESFDARIRERLGSPSLFRLPVVQCRSRGWRTFLRSKNQSQSYIPKSQLRLSLGPFCGTVELDLLGKAGHVTVSSLEFGAKENEFTMSFEGADLVSLIALHGDGCVLATSAGGMQFVQQAPSFFRLRPPATFNKCPYWIRLSLTDIEEENERQ